MTSKKVYILGTFDTKSVELNFIKDALEKMGIATVRVDVSTKKPENNSTNEADVAPVTVFPQIYSTIFSSRGEAISKMGEALDQYLSRQGDIAGVIGLGGSGGTSLISRGMASLPAGLPKVIVSTMASGNIRPYVGANDIYMVYSIIDIKGINAISNTILSNAAHAIGGMVLHQVPHYQITHNSVGITMFGVTTPCVNTVVSLLEKDFECLVFHATGVGGQSMEKLIDEGYIKYVLDITTTEIADLLMGGELSAGEDRLGAIIRKKIPYVGSVGALDMVNFGSIETVPEKYKTRNLYKHNAQVTLMRTTKEENIQIARWIASKLNQMEGPVRFLLPEKGISILDAAGQSFYDPKADKALFDTLEQEVIQTANRKIIRYPYAINDPAFSQALVDNFLAIIP